MNRSTPAQSVRWSSNTTPFSDSRRYGSCVRNTIQARSPGTSTGSFGLRVTNSRGFSPKRRSPTKRTEKPFLTTLRASCDPTGASRASPAETGLVQYNQFGDPRRAFEIAPSALSRLNFGVEPPHRNPTRKRGGSRNQLHSSFTLRVTISVTDPNVCPDKALCSLRQSASPGVFHDPT